MTKMDEQRAKLNDQQAYYERLFLHPIAELANDTWVKITNANTIDHFNEDGDCLFMRVGDFRMAFQEKLKVFLQNQKSGFYIDEFLLSSEDSIYDIREYTCKMRYDDYVSDLEEKYLSPIASLADSDLVVLTRVPHDGCPEEGAQYRGYHELILTAGEFRRQFQEQANIIIDSCYERLLIEVDNDRTFDLCYHDYYEIEEHSLEAQELRRREAAIKQQIEDLGAQIPQDLFYGRNNYWHRDDTGMLCGPQSMPSFPPEKILEFAKIIELYLASKASASTT